MLVTLASQIISNFNWSLLFTPQYLLLHWSPCSLCINTCFLTNILLYDFYCSENLHRRFLVYLFQSINTDGAHVVCVCRGVGEHWWLKCLRECVKKNLWCAIYCFKPRPDSKSQSVSRHHRGMGRQSLWIMQGYDLASAFEIGLLIRPHTCEMCSKTFFAMSWLKSKRITRCSFLSKPSKKRKLLV